MATSDFIPNTVTIQLTQGQVAIVDTVDSDLADLKWSATYNPSGRCYYACRATPLGNGKRKTEYLHRVILSRIIGRTLLRKEQVDHIHHDTLDNRRSELRIATHAQNSWNQGLRRDNTSGFKGVVFFPRTGQWTARIHLPNKNLNLGYYATPEEAARAYDAAARELYGGFAVLNFPEL